MPRRDHHQRHGFGIGLRHAAERVLGPRPLLHGEDADAIAARDAAQRVRHMHAGAFLAHQDRLDAGLGRRLDQPVARIAAEIFEALALEDFGDGGVDLHFTASLLHVGSIYRQFGFVGIFSMQRQ